MSTTAHHQSMMTGIIHNLQDDSAVEKRSYRAVVGTRTRMGGKCPPAVVEDSACASTKKPATAVVSVSNVAR
jgi:hypothetical protein